MAEIKCPHCHKTIELTVTGVRRKPAAKKAAMRISGSSPYPKSHKSGVGKSKGSK